MNPSPSLDSPSAPREVVDVDLHFLRKVRGLQTICRYSARDDGTCLVSIADPMEARAFQVARVGADDGPLPLAAYRVETLRKVEISADTGTDSAVGEAPPTPRYIGISDDALYGFIGGRKSRYLADRRAAFADVSLGEEGLRFTVLFSDLLASGWAVALGTLADNGGRLLWTKDIGFAAARACVDRSGAWVAVAGGDGDVQVFGSGRELAVRAWQNVRISALATLGPELTLIAGVADESGVAVCLGEGGNRQWLTQVTGTPLEIGCDGTGQVVAVLTRLDDGSGRLILLGAGGLPAADVELSAPPTGLSVAPGGEYVAVSLRDGTLAVYAPRFGPRMAEADGTDVVARARELGVAGRYPDAAALLQARLDASPADLDACDALTEIVNPWRSETLRQAGELAAQEQWADADALLGRFLAAPGSLPLDPQVTRERLALREGWAASALRRGREALLAEDTDEAERLLQEAVQADPLGREARAVLRSAQAAARLRLEREGQARLRAGDFAQAAHLLRQARQSGANRPEIAQLLREAQIGEALAEGNHLYRERQYDAACFHFKKVLRLRPDHAEARQRLGYAESMSQSSPTSDRFRRLE